MKTQERNPASSPANSPRWSNTRRNTSLVTSSGSLRSVEPGVAAHPSRHRLVQPPARRSRALLRLRQDVGELGRQARLRCVRSRCRHPGVVDQGQVPLEAGIAPGADRTRYFPPRRAGSTDISALRLWSTTRVQADDRARTGDRGAGRGVRPLQVHRRRGSSSWRSNGPGHPAAGHAIRRCSGRWNRCWSPWPKPASRRSSHRARRS